VPAHDLVATDGRAFWFTVPVVREDSRKIAQFRNWIGDEATAARDSAAEFIRRVRTS
jgi:LysR family glycine cleavage system transcriptional activator